MQSDYVSFYSMVCRNIAKCQIYLPKILADEPIEELCFWAWRCKMVDVRPRKMEVLHCVNHL